VTGKLTPPHKKKKHTQSQLAQSSQKKAPFSHFNKLEAGTKKQNKQESNFNQDLVIKTTQQAGTGVKRTN
jgi:hypothetical protein